MYSKALTYESFLGEGKNAGEAQNERGRGQNERGAGTRVRTRVRLCNASGEGWSRVEGGEGGDTRV